MAGHSKWKQIKHKKAITDAKKGQLFSKLVREITIAVEGGGADPSTNTRLRAAIERSRSEGLPKDNIERAIERAGGPGDAAKLQEFLYEAIAPGGIYILTEGITDNNNRTLVEVRKILTKYSVKLVPPNSLLWNFEKVWTEEGKDYRPKNPLEIPHEERGEILPLLDELVDHPDVQEVYTNLLEE